MKHFILGTAGHIDHGKTLLVKALTGIDCDTHDEEKKRGITIHLGFAHLDFPSGEVVGIVDMPGHKDFIHTMVSGASGIDIALLAISADSGIMPQTREHLWIMQALGIEKGLVAMTKVDAVDSETAEIAEEDIKSFIKGTFLEKSPIIRVSSVTGQGIEELRREIFELVKISEPRTGEGIFRMYPDRIFSIPGFGSVLTGSVVEGKVKKEEKVFLIPGKGREFRIRRMERHGKETDEIFTGDRASVNLVGLEREDFVRGTLISNRLLEQTRMIDSRITLFKDVKKLPVWSNVIFLLGTNELQARVHLISADVLKPGESADVQLQLSKSVVTRYGDRFIVRSTSDDCTLGGGYVTDSHPLHHRRRTEKVRKKTARIAEGGFSAAIYEEIGKKGGVVRLSNISRSMNVHENQILMEVEKTKKISVFTHKNDFILAERDEEISVRKKIPAIIRSFIEKNPLLNRGPTSDEIKNSAFAKKGQVYGEFILKLLDDLRKNGIVGKKGENWSMVGETEEMDQKQVEWVGIVGKFLEDAGLKIPRYGELAQHAAKFKMGEKDLNLVLNYLVSKKKAYRIEGEYISTKTVEEAKKALTKEISHSDRGLTVAQFRDLIGGNRKICLLLFALFDAEGLTVRKGDLRFVIRKS
ncbi:selenocysteine-specific translation elongation factor [candidate division WOR-3 bacterium]|nr:selenocysteine-specific translation elongation factor [candidate division WOR-3 bacterium]